MIITQAFDSGNIEVLAGTDPSNIRLAIRPDSKSHFFQWFHFRLTHREGESVTCTIENASKAAYIDGWDGYQVCASYDRESWFRVDTRYEDGELTFQHELEANSIWFAYFAPYSMERHADLIADAAQSPFVNTQVLGHTLDGQDMDLLEIGEAGAGRKTVWLIARQHPGETMAEWWMEGALDLLLDPDHPVGRLLRDKAHIFVVPNMNPDGSKRGNLRTNAAGANLNREWKDPSMDRSPEVFLVRQKMLETGVDFHLDVHGDEGLPYNFIAGFEGIPSLTDKQSRLHDRYQARLEVLSPDFQTQYGYPVDAPGTADLKKCTDYVAETFGCLAMTLEMPFKDNANLPDPDYGWSPDRCRHLAQACLMTLAEMLDEL